MLLKLLFVQTVASSSSCISYQFLLPRPLLARVRLGRYVDIQLAFIASFCGCFVNLVNECSHRTSVFPGNTLMVELSLAKESFRSLHFDRPLIQQNAPRNPLLLLSSALGIQRNVSLQQLMRLTHQVLLLARGRGTADI